jgi:CubicO group peptidase (beta-lactamase class C family)
VSKPFVATAVASLASTRRPGGAVLDLDAPITDWVPELTLADGRAAEVTARGLLSHTSGLPDVYEYGWHDPQLGDDALSVLAGSLSGWRLQSDPGSTYSYSNVGYELLGLLLSRVTGRTFESAVNEEVLAPLGMRDSTFLRSEVPAHLAAAPHVGMPLTVPQGVYPYTRRHAPSSSLHSDLTDMCRWIVAHCEPVDQSDTSDGDTDGEGDGSGEPQARLDRGLLDLMWRPVVPVGEPPWEESMALGWSVGRYRGARTLSHSGADPGFGTRLVVVPERRTGVIVLANSNTVPTWTIAAAALDIALSDDATSSTGPRGTPERAAGAVASLGAILPPVVREVADTLTTSGPAAAAATFRRLAAEEPARFDLDDEEFVKAVWGAIELHRTTLVWPLLRVWSSVRPDSSNAWTMTGWAHKVDGDLDLARDRLRRALDLDPENAEAAQLLSDLPAR